jgi:hypothetical protein
MGAVERNGYIFEPEFSVISQDGAIHVYHNGEFRDEIKFSFFGEFPEMDQIEKIIEEYCIQNGI